MLKRYRKALLFLALAVVVALAIFAPEPEEPAAPAKGAKPVAQQKSDTPTASTKSSPEPAASAGIGAMPERSALGKTQVDLFGSRSWVPPPPPKAAVSPADVAPPPPPPPPPQTYRFAGRLAQGGIVQFYVSKGDTPVAVKPGANLDGYVVESVFPDRIALVYPPLGHKENIVVPPALPGDPPATPVGAGPAAGASPAPTVQLPKPPAPVARVQWQGPAEVRMGAPFTVALRVFSDQAFRGSPMQVRFDPAVLEAVSVRPGKRYAAEAGRGFTSRTGRDGMILIGASAKSAVTNDPELVVLTFKPRKAGVQAEVKLASLDLLGAEGKSLPHDGLASWRASVKP